MCCFNFMFLPQWPFFRILISASEGSFCSRNHCFAPCFNLLLWIIFTHSNLVSYISGTHPNPIRVLLRRVSDKIFEWSELSMDLGVTQQYDILAKTTLITTCALPIVKGAYSDAPWNSGMSIVMWMAGPGACPPHDISIEVLKFCYRNS